MHVDTRATRRLVAGLLAASLAVGQAGTVTALAPSTTTTPRSLTEPTANPGAPALPRAVRRPVAPFGLGGAALAGERATTPDPADAVAERTSVAGPIPTPATPVRSAVQPPTAEPRQPAVRAAAAAPRKPVYRGRNHIWIPSLGVSRDLSWFSCSRTRPPGHRLYQWGCAGRNNVYVFAHAASVFSQLHSAYVNGRLRKGMRVIHADSKGRIRTYKVRFWKVVSPVGQSWAYAGQSTPSMTLQTCVGARSQYRLIVRLTLA
jgi:hypothetical protein